MEIQFTIWGEYDEVEKNKVNGRPPETVGVLRVKINRVVVHEEECPVYASPNDQESAIYALIKKVFAKLNG